MRTFLITFGEPLVWVLAAVEALLGVLCLRSGKRILNRLSAAVCFGLTIDAAIMGLGVLLGEGALLQSVSQIRYILHGILVPLLIPIAFYAYGMKSVMAQRILWAVTGVIMACGIAMGVMTRTEPAALAGVLRYASSAETPAFARMMDRLLSFGGVIPLMVVGLAHLFRHRKGWLLLSGVSMFAFAALAPATHNMDLNFLLTMVGEALMVLFFWLEDRKA